MSNDLVVAITVGQRDLQVLAVGPAGLVRVSPAKSHVGALHRALRDGSLPYRFLVPAELPKEERFAEAVWRDGTLSFSSADLRLAAAADLGESAGPEAVWIVPGLLARGLQALAAGSSLVRRVLFFTTDREGGGRAEGEPVAVVPVFRGWLESHGLGKVVQEARCLGPAETLTLRDQADNSRLRPEAAERVDAALRQAAAEFPGAAVRLHVAGGIPALAEVVQASAQMRFSTVQYHSPSEDIPATATSAPPFTPVEALQGRRQVAELVSRGQFQAAAVLAERFRQDGRCGDWQRAVAAAARYLAGYMTTARELATAIPASCTGPFLVGMTDQSLPQAFHVALRAEAALRAGDVLTGASLTVTFLDVALLDAADRTLRRDRSRTCINWERREIVRANFLPTRQDAHEAGRQVRPDEWIGGYYADDIDRWYEFRAREDRPPAPTIRCHQLWQEWLLARLLAGVGGNPPLAGALDDFSESLHKPSAQRHRPADFRNRLIHSLPTQAEVELMVQLFESRGLWHRRQGQPRQFIHPEARASAVLAGLGCSVAADSYRGLTEAIAADIAAAPLHG